MIQTIPDLVALSSKMTSNESFLKFYRYLAKTCHYDVKIFQLEVIRN